jgi:hypothetical protein
MNGTARLSDNELKPYHWCHIRRIGWRLLSVLALFICIMLALMGFSRKGNLSRMDRRWFNVIMIVLSSLVSLAAGSLLTLLGGMIRWRILATQKGHTPRDVLPQPKRTGNKLTYLKVDLILGMPLPTGALKLVWDHIKSTIHAVTAELRLINL